MHRIAPYNSPRKAVPTPQTCQRFLRSLATSFAQDIRENGIEGDGLIFSWPHKQTIREPGEEQQAEIVAVKERLRKYNEELRSERSTCQQPERELVSEIQRIDRMRKAEEYRVRLAELEAIEIRLQGEHPAPLDLLRLNASLGQSLADRTGVTNRDVLWAAYTKAKQTVPGLLESISEATWQLIWNIQAGSSPYQDSQRNRRLDELLKDIYSTGRSPLQGFARVEALCHAGEHEEAIDLWEKHKRHVSDKGALDYLQLGIRIHAAAGDPNQAQLLLDELREKHSNWDARTIIPLLISFNTCDGRDLSRAYCHQAWALYLLLQQRTSDLTRLEYEAIYSSFLSSRQRDLSIAVFMDMLAQTSRSGDYPKGLRGQVYLYIRRLQFLSKTTSQINQASLLGLKIMQNHHQNVDIYKTWLGKLASLREGLSVAQLLELMYERGIELTARQLNTVVRALLRRLQSGDVSQRLTARRRGEELAWFMIRERLDFGWRQRVSKRDGSLLDEKPAGELEDNAHIPIFLRRPVAPATNETFDILLRYYTVGKLRKRNKSYVSHLRNVRKSSGVPADVTFLAQLIFRDMRWGHYRAAWTKVKKFSYSVQANSGVYAKLWYGMTLYVDRTKNSWHAGYPPPRTLFARMERAFSDPTYASGVRPHEFITRETYNWIISSFCMVPDLSGALVALHALKTRFGYYPQQSAARAVVKQVARVGLPVPRSYRQLRVLERSPVYRRRLAFVVQKLRELNAGRRKAAGAHGFFANELSDHEVAEMDLNSISELLRAVLMMNTSALEAERSIHRAKVEMGVHRIDTGDVDCLHIERGMKAKQATPVARSSERSSEDTLANRNPARAAAHGS
ncbi:hypothetical protein H2201_000519 [Coniosporium apollinis]|uniref:Pentatricopeptide repeat domain-containing protein n=1 Tax=Coniosporium apollinis TaxID=61459 RepID=A0ABQ9P504_9PEZI|nr:hypothetical protein H2201_000519 [Coniosporium apollinis]